MVHASSSDDKITLKLFKTGTPTAVAEFVVTDKAAVSHEFTLANIETSSTGTYTSEVTYGSFGSATSTPPYQVREFSMLTND